MRRTNGRSARRIHPPVSAALDAINASHRNELRSRSRENPPAPAPHRPSASPSRHHHRAASRNKSTHTPNHEAHFFYSPSDLWRHLPVQHRLIPLILGFVSLYYFLLAKHHHYDKERIAIHSEVEDLMRQAKAAGLGEHRHEAVLPSIFRQPVLIPTLALAMRNEANAGKRSVDVSEKGEGSEDNIQLPSEPSKLRRRPMTNKQTRNASKKRVRSKRTAAVLTSVARTTESTLNATLDAVAEGSELSSPALPSAQTTSGNGTAVSPTSDEKGPQGSSTPGDSSRVVPEDAGGKAFDSVQVLPKNLAETNSTHQSSSVAQVPGSGNASMTSVGISGGSVGSPGGNASISAAAQAASVDHGPDTNEQERDYSTEFKDLSGDEVPPDHIPVLDWNYEAVIDPETTEQIFGLGNKLDHVAVYKPLCVDTSGGEAISFSGRRVCSGFNRTSGWMHQYCNVMQESLAREYLLNVKEKPKQWLEEQASAIHWVEGLTVLQIMERNCGNIAHYSGRALFLQHIIDNVAAYVGPPSRIENILILPTFHIMKRFLYPHNYKFWHKSVFSALIAPAQFTIGTLRNFLYREKMVPFNGVPRVQLLHNFTVSGSLASDKKYVCFRRAIVPGYLKARFFVSDIEYPSTKPSLQSSILGAPPVPRDSLRFRERVSSLFQQTATFPAMKKEVIFLDRAGSRRVLENTTRTILIQSFQKICTEQGFAFKVVSFDRMNFKEQYTVMQSAAIAIGIHGANLVNAMFMPPLSALIELYPFGFMHDMYVDGGNAGLKYYKYQMISGIPFQGPRQYRSVEQCIKLNHQCKVHYRDSALKVTDADMTAMQDLLKEAIAWCNNRSKISSAIATRQTSAPQDVKRRKSLLFHRTYRNLGS